MKRVKQRIKDQIKQKLIELRYERYDPAQVLLAIDLVYNEIPEDDNRLSNISALIGLREIVLQKYRVETIMQGFSQIYKYQELAKALLNTKLTYYKLTIKDFRCIIKEVYGTDDLLEAYSLMWELYKIGLVTSIKTHNNMTSCHVCKSYNEILRFLS